MQKKNQRNRPPESVQIMYYRCKNLIVVIEDPKDIRNMGTVIRNVNALSVEKAYVVDPNQALPDDWQEMREKRSLSKSSGSAVKWSFVKRFDSTEDCLTNLVENRFISYDISPHIKGKHNAILEDVDFTVEAGDTGPIRFRIALKLD